MTNDLTYVMLEVIDEMSPILEPKPNVRLHQNSPEALLDKIVDMIESSQGAPFLLNFDERSMAGMMLEARRAGLADLINQDNVHEYAPVGCLENTMVGNDRSGTVDNNINLLKAVELTLTGGKDLLPFYDPMTGKTEPVRQDGPRTPDASSLKTWEDFWKAYGVQTRYIIQKCVDLYETSESIRARFFPTPYLSCLVTGCAEKGNRRHAGRGSNQFRHPGSRHLCDHRGFAAGHQISGLRQKSLHDAGTGCRPYRPTGKGYEVLQAMAKNRAPKYGRDDDEADRLARQVMQLWCDEAWRHRTKATGRQFRPGMLSWNYWAGDGYIMAASADGRTKGQFLSNAICPSNGADIKGPTANTNSVGKVLGGKAEDGRGDWQDYLNELPNGASHTITFNPSILRDPVHKDKFKAFLKGYTHNGGTALQINMLDPDMLKDAQAHPQDYRHLLVRITGYNAYFTTVGRELQNEVIERVSHNKF